VFWVISVYFNIRNTLPKSGTFLLGHPVYIYIYNIILTALLNGPYQKFRILHKPVSYVEYMYPILLAIHTIRIVSVKSHLSASSSSSKVCIIKTIHVRGIEDSLLIGDNAALIVNRITMFQGNKIFFSRTYWPLDKNITNRCKTFNPVLKVTPGKTYSKHYWLLLFPKLYSECQKSYTSYLKIALFVPSNSS